MPASQTASSHKSMGDQATLTNDVGFEYDVIARFMFAGLVREEARPMRRCGVRTVAKGG